MKNIHILPTDKPDFVIFKNRHLGDRLFHWNMDLGNPMNRLNYIGQNIYITSDEEIKEGAWAFDLCEDLGLKYHPFKVDKATLKFAKQECKKIILTTDIDLIKDGVQAIDDEFLEWFVKNPSCEVVEVEESTLLNTSRTYLNIDKYKIIIPKEEPKQIYYNTVGIENGVNVVKGQFNTQKEALDLANELNRKSPDLYYDWRETLIKEKPKQEIVKDLVYWKANAEEDYIRVPISVLRYISELENQMYSEEEVIVMLKSHKLYIISELRGLSKFKNEKEWFEQFKKK